MNLIVRCRHTRANYQGPDLGGFAGNRERGLSICHQPRRLRRRLNPGGFGIDQEGQKTGCESAWEKERAARCRS